MSSDYKAALHRYLADARQAMLWKLEGFSEYDIRRPLTPHGTNLLGLVKHLSGREIGYFGLVFDRPFADPPAWLTTTDSKPDPIRDMWATADESRSDIVVLYGRACQHSDHTIEALSLDDRGQIPAWPEHRRSVTLHDVLVHMLAETTRHAGHADILRELIDNTTGVTPGGLQPPDANDPDFWPRTYERIDSAAREAAAHASWSTPTTR
ncbi:DinB family protein [Mycolicibacterium sediminis]|nr:DinB family protein [Mycolicibacterium sediminis]